MASHEFNLWRLATQRGQPASGLPLNECFHALPYQLRFFSARLCQCHGFGEQIVIDGQRCSHGSFLASIKASFFTQLNILTDQRVIEHFDPMAHRRGGAALQVRDATDVG